ncbi:MAG: 2-phospho-L-lactate guanylyltransferase [Chloroflexota bacterium]
MIAVAAIVPVKSLQAAKTRLIGELNPDERGALAGRLLRGVLATLASAPAIAAWAVVSRDDRALELAREWGGQAIREAGSDLNSALDQARRWAVDAGMEAILVLPADVPLLTVEDVDGMAAAADESDVVIAPSGDGGTNGLFLRPPDVIPFRFGPGSAALHRREAMQRHLSVKTFVSHTLAFDVDTPEDLRRYREIGAANRAEPVRREPSAPAHPLALGGGS